MVLSEWRFTKGNPHGAERGSFDDATWEQVRVPHDWGTAGPFDPDGHGGTGKLPWRGEGWYRTSFALDEADAGKRAYLDFAGVMAFPKVYVNGALAGKWDYGYNSFRIDASEQARVGQNVVAVHVDTRRHASRWYPGAGLLTATADGLQAATATLTSR
ncbi:MAG: sugar-binding domain-containing protein [Planctomycetota bacterium]